MATRQKANILAQEPRNGAARPRLAGKEKAEPRGNGKNRRALQDIGNLLDARAVEGVAAKPLVNPQANAATYKKAVVVAADKCRRAAKVVNSKPETIVISSDSEGQNKQRDLKDFKNTSRPAVHTLTSVLTARSKAAGVFTSNPIKRVHDIDSLDCDNELAVVEYVEDIYKFYKLAERTSQPHDYMSSQTEINSRMRAILSDWLVEVHNKFTLMPETLYLAIYVIDKYLSTEPVPKKELQLVGISAMLIACKYEEIWAPEIKDFIYISDGIYTREQILGKEKAILNRLQWNLTVPTTYVFLVRYLKAAKGDKELEHMASLYAELALVHYSMIKYPPSTTAAACVYAARCTLKLNPAWSDILEYHSGLSASQLLECAIHLISYHKSASESKQKAVYHKYSSIKRGAAVLRTPAKKLC